MKKFIIFLISIIILFPLKSNAKTTTFYEGEYIENVWMNKLTPDKQTIYYKKARFFREKKTNTIAYCIEPFTMFNEESKYNSTINPNNLTEEQKERIKLLAFLGYAHKDKGQPIWYAVTQLLIWQTADPNGDYYFTDSLNGNKIDTYQNLIERLNNDVEKYKNHSSFNKEYNITLGEKIEITDEFAFFTKNTSNNKYVTIDNKTIIIENLPVGKHNIIINKKEEIYGNTPIVFYQSETSQNIVTLGNLEPENITITVNVKDTSLKINKVDYDTNSKIPSGNAKLEGAKYKIYTEEHKEIKEITLTNSLTATITGLPIGKYYIKEIEAGTGYEIDQNTYKFELTPNNSKIELTLKNKVIKGTIELYKVYIENDTEIPEKNISFNIYDHKKNIIKTITTNEEGYTKTNLPYGIYYIEQINTTEGYQYVEPFPIIIKDSLTLTYHLKNYKIEVPDTHANNFTIIKYILKNIIKFIGEIYDYKTITSISMF